MIKVFDKTDRLFSLIGKHAPVSFTELLRLSGLNKATLSQILKSMVELNWLERNSDGRFRIGSKILILAESKCVNTEMRDSCVTIAKELNQELNELAVVAVFSEGERRLIARIESDQLVQVNESVCSTPESMFNTATGLVLLSGLDEKSRIIFAERHGLKNLLLKSEERLAQILRDGYCRIIMGKNDSMRLAVGVYRDSGKIAAAIGFSAPCYRFKPNTAQAVEILNKYAKQISSRLQ